MTGDSHDDLIAAATAVLNPRRVPRFGGPLLGDAEQQECGRQMGHVACALVTDAGHRHVGVCIDTGSGTGFCAEHAEHAAIAAMVTAGEYRIRAIVAVWRDSDGTLFVLPPCGRCREFMRQVDPANIDAEVVVGRGSTAQLSDLLPRHEWPAPLDPMTTG